jgi:hypothetical protein
MIENIWKEAVVAYFEFRSRKFTFSDWKIYQTLSPNSAPSRHVLILGVLSAKQKLLAIGPQIWVTLSEVLFIFVKASQRAKERRSD